MLLKWITQILYTTILIFHIIQTLYSDTIPDVVTGSVMFSGNGNSKKTWFDDLEVGY